MIALGQHVMNIQWLSKCDCNSKAFKPYTMMYLVLIMARPILSNQL